MIVGALPRTRPFRTSHCLGSLAGMIRETEGISGGMLVLVVILSFAVPCGVGSNKEASQRFDPLGW